MSQSKRELREQRKAVREATERAEQAASVRRRRLWSLGGAAATAAVIVAIVAAVSSSGSPKPVKTSNVVAGVSEHKGVLGDPNAPVTVTEYLDPQCPVCAAASQQFVPSLIANYVKTGKVKLQARTLSFLGPDSVTAARAAQGAAQQNKMWSFLETFYASQGEENSGYVTDAFLKNVAAAAGVNASQALEYADTAQAQRALDQADSAAQAVGADSTPTFTVKRGSGPETVLSVGLVDPAPALEKALAG